MAADRKSVLRIFFVLLLYTSASRSDYHQESPSKNLNHDIQPTSWKANISLPENSHIIYFNTFSRFISQSPESKTAKLSLPITKFSKHGPIIMALPRSFFITDLAVCMDIHRNPGPDPKSSVSQRNLSSDTDLHICTAAGKVNYSRKQLLELRMKSTLQPDLYLLLKAQGILRNPRTRAGKFLKQSRRLFNI